MHFGRLFSIFCAMTSHSSKSALPTPILRLAERVVIPVKYKKLLSLESRSNFTPFFTRDSLEAFGPNAGKSVKSHAPTMSFPSRNICLSLFAAEEEAPCVAPFLRTLFAVKRLDGLYGCEPYGRAMTHAKLPALHLVFCIKPLSKSSAGFPNPSAKTSETSRNCETNTLWFPKHCEHSQSFLLLLSVLLSSSCSDVVVVVVVVTVSFALSLLVSAKASCSSSPSSSAREELEDELVVDFVTTLKLTLCC